MPQGSLWLHAETLASTALDLDLFVGRDTNGDGLAQESEELCSSTTPQDLEVCDIFDPVPGSYWILVQNWDASDSEPDNATLVRAVVGNSGELGLTATAQGMTETNETFPVRVSWNNVDAVSGQSLVGAVGVGTDRANPNNLGIIPVRFNRTFIKAPTTLALMDGRSQHLALRANNSHDRVFIDVPDSATSLTVSASGGDGTESDALTIELKRVGFDAAFAEAPEVPAAPEGGAIVSASGANGEGPSVTVSGSSLEAGRWYVVLSNGSGAEISASVQADVEFAGGQSAVSPGLWEPESRPGINQGFDYALGAARAILWYTYDEAGLPAWYLASDLEPDGDIWVANVLRYTNDGAEQQPTVVGQVAEVSVEGGGLRVHRVVCVVDCGLAVNPDIVEAQMESAITFGLSAAMYGEITSTEGAIEQQNFDTYPVLRLNDCPHIDVHLLSSGDFPYGVGEPGTPPSAPALVNALYGATGKRFRQLPIRL